MEDVVALAREDPAAARQLLTVITVYCRGQAEYDRGRNLVIGIGVSPDVLPTYEQFRAARLAQGFTEDDQ